MRTIPVTDLDNANPTPWLIARGGASITPRAEKIALDLVQLDPSDAIASVLSLSKEDQSNVYRAPLLSKTIAA